MPLCDISESINQLSTNPKTERAAPQFSGKLASPTSEIKSLIREQGEVDQGNISGAGIGMW